MAGASAGVIAGIVMGLVAMTRASSMGMSFWFPVQQIAATFFGVDALLGGFWPTFIGMMTHLVVAGCFGAVIGLVTARMSAINALWAGLVAGTRQRARHPMCSRETARMAALQQATYVPA